MKNSYFFIAVILIFLFSYCSQKKEVGDILSDNCYWDIFEEGASHPINSCYRFRSNGECAFYYYNFYDKKRTDSIYRYNDGDRIVSNKWDIIKDSINIRGIRYKIEKYSADSVFISFKERMITLIKNCSTRNPKESE